MMSIGKKKNLLDRRRTVAERIAFIAGFCILTLWALLLLYMLFWAVTSSFKTNIETKECIFRFFLRHDRVLF